MPPDARNSGRKEKWVRTSLGRLKVNLFASNAGKLRVWIKNFVHGNEKLLSYSIAFVGAGVLTIWLLSIIVYPERRAEYLNLARSNLITVDSLRQVRVVNALAQDSLERLKAIQSTELQKIFSQKQELMSWRVSIDSSIQSLRHDFSILVEQLELSDSLRKEYKWRFEDLAQDSSVGGASTSITIELKEGWNMIGYTKSSPIPAELAFLSLGESLIAVVDEFDHIYDPVKDINEIGSLHPGKGYLVLVSKHSVFSFP